MHITINTIQKANSTRKKEFATCNDDVETQTPLGEYNTFCVCVSVCVCVFGENVREYFLNDSICWLFVCTYMLSVSLYYTWYF